jgi:predicted Rossmann fold flavoprotein
MTDPEIVVVGAGAAGLWAAARAARLGRRVLLLEKTPRTGTKVLASGGTRCNLTTTLDAAGAARLFGREGGRFLRTALRVLPPLEVRSRFEAWGVPTDEAPLEKVFPRSGRARDVRDALEREAREAGVAIELGAAVEGVARAGDGWTVRIAGGRTARAPRLLLCPGGRSYPRSGTTGDGYRWLRALGLPVVEPVPALVPLRSPAGWVRDLAGIAPQDVEARLYDADRRLVARRRRPVVFTHHGLSGPGAMDLSGALARAGDRARELALLLDLLPDVPHEEVRAALLRAHDLRGGPRLAGALPWPVPRRLFEAVARAAGLGNGDVRANALDREGRHRLVEALKGLPVPVDGTLGFDHAEVTAGGLALEAVDPGTMRVRGMDGLWVFGELLDLDGPIGGLNFQAAFATAELAARDAAAR